MRIAGTGHAIDTATSSALRGEGYDTMTSQFRVDSDKNAELAQGSKEYTSGKMK